MVNNLNAYICKIFMKQSDYAVHCHVVVVCRYGFLFLEAEAYSDFVCLGGFRQEAVIIALAATEAVALLVESHAGHYGHVDTAVVGVDFARWFHYPVMSGGKVGWCCVDAQLHVGVAGDAWQQHRLACLYEAVYGVVGAYFVGQGVIHEYCFCFCDGEVGQQP